VDLRGFLLRRRLRQRVGGEVVGAAFRQPRLWLGIRGPEKGIAGERTAGFSEKKKKKRWQKKGVDVVRTERGGTIKRKKAEETGS